ncbi:MAG: efflux RND transporter periplasmic adaptor subunit [Chthonomonas sp.]|nr:efflux RND transporter periplasmic adaptor subunit [Chthonomonas sp.]
MKKRLPLIGLVLLVAVCGGGMVALNGFRTAQMMAAKPKVSDTTKVERGPILVQVVESGAIEAVRVVELKSRAAGRLAKLVRGEGDQVASGELIAIIDPTETRLQVEQNSAQLRGAEAGVARQDIEIRQRRVTAATSLERARQRVAQLEREAKVQPTLTKSGIAAAQAALATAEKQLDLLVKTTQPNERTTTQSEFDQTQLNLDNALRELGRLESLLKQDYVSQREVDTQRLSVEIARNRRDAARARLSRLAEQQLNERRQAEERVRQSKADLDRARANGVQDSAKLTELREARIALREAEVALSDVDALFASRRQGQASVDQIRSSLSDSQRQLGETSIRAPYAGVITKRLVQEGELVSSLSSFSSGTPIVRLEDRSKMIVKLNINEIDVAKLKEGMKATILIDALPKETFEGEVTRVAPAKNQTSTDQVVRYEVEVRLDNPNGLIKSGMTAKCTMDVVNLSKTLRVPIDYVIKEGAKRFVMVLPEKPKEQDQGKKTEVKTGAESASYIEVISGVGEGSVLKRPSYSGPKRGGAAIRVED